MDGMAKDMVAKSSSWGVKDVKKVGNIQLCQRRSYSIPIHLHVSPFSQGKVDFHWIFMGFLMDFSGFPLHFQVPQKKGFSPAEPPSLRPKTFALLGSPLRARCCHRSAASWLLARVQEPSTISSTNSIQ